MKKIYIAGKVTEETPEVRERKFIKAEVELRVAGFDVVNPIKLIDDPNTEWEDAMKKCISEMMFCDAVVLLPCWEDSKGAAIERQLADDLDIPIFNLHKKGLEVMVRYFKINILKRKQIAKKGNK